MNKTVLVTGIGGNVGQGVLKNIRNLKYLLRIIGTNTEFVSAGNHLCDMVYEVPQAQDQSYIKKIQTICRKEHVDLIIPCTDAETYYLAIHQPALPELSSSPSVTAEVFFNKYVTFTVFADHGIPFAETVLPSAYKNNFTHYVVKPVTGRGSRNVFINSPHPSDFSDDYIIQKLYKGKEITTSFYVTKTNTLLGFITFERSLTNGMTTSCQVVCDYDKQLTDIITKLMSVVTIKGSCNIQSIVNKHTGRVVPFEVNGRISGTNSIRPYFGFNDVAYTIDEYLYNKQLEKPNITLGSCIRYTSDIIYPNISLEQIRNKSDSFLLP